MLHNNKDINVALAHLKEFLQARKFKIYVHISDSLYWTVQY